VLLSRTFTAILLFSNLSTSKPFRFKTFVKNVKTGKSGDPSKLAPLISKGNSDYHSHASGEKGKFAWQQPPTKQDIQTCRPNRSEYVFGMRSKIIYKYDKKGVKATLPFNTIIK
jgi:hypothetical protein